MAQLVDIKDLTIGLANEIIGSDFFSVSKTGNIVDIEGQDTWKLVDVGEKITNSSNLGLDNFAQKMLARISEVYITEDIYKSELGDFLTMPREFYGALEFITVLPYTYQSGDLFNVADGTDFSSDEHTYHKPSIVSKFYNEIKDIKVVYSTTEESMKTAFTSWEEMEKLYAGMALAVQNTIEVALDAWKHALLSAGVAISDDNTGTARHLLTEYNALMATIDEDWTNINAEEARQNQGFLVYAVREIEKTYKQFGVMSTAFNDGEYPTFSNDTRLVLLNDFVLDVKYNLDRISFHNEDIDLPNYKAITQWQGHNSQSAGAFSYENNSSIMISADATEKLGIGTSAYSASDCIGLMYDNKGIAISPLRRKTTSSYTASADFWNLYNFVITDYLINTNRNIVAFFID